MRAVRLTAAVCLAAALAADGSDFATLKANAVREYLKGPCATERDLRSVNADGSFEGVDYASGDRGSWPTGASVERIRAFAVAARRHPDDRRFAEAFHRTFGFFVGKKRSNANWWWPAIGVPKELGPAMVLMEGELSADEREKGLAYLKGAYFGQTGQNRELLAWCVLQRAMLENDEALARKCREEMAAVFRFGPKGGEGLMRDGIYHLHGHQPQMGGYGQQLVLDVMRYAPVFRGTSFDFSESERAAILALVRDGYSWLYWRGRMEPGSVGRQIWPGSQQGRGDFIRRALDVIGTSCGDGPIPGDRVGFKFFDDSAMAVYRATNWMASVKMTIRSVPGVERVNSDNLKGGDFADGSMFTLVTGREYDDIYPLWNNWRVLPGLTSDPDEDVWNPRKWWGGQHSPNGEDFCAGAGDAALAAVSFRFDDGITSYLATRVFTPEFAFTVKGGVTGKATTCIEHAFDATPQPKAKGKSKEQVEAVSSDVSPTRLMNGTVGYVVPKGCEVRRAKVSGDWHEIMGGMPKGSVREGRTFRVTYAHRGADSVAWYVLPATTRERLAGFDDGAVKVVENDAAHQVLDVPSLGRRIVVTVGKGVEITSAGK